MLHSSPQQFHLALLHARSGLNKFACPNSRSDAGVIEKERDVRNSSASVVEIIYGKRGLGVDELCWRDGIADGGWGNLLEYSDKEPGFVARDGRNEGREDTHLALHKEMEIYTIIPCSFSHIAQMNTALDALCGQFRLNVIMTMRAGQGWFWLLLLAICPWDYWISQRSKPVTVTPPFNYDTIGRASGTAVALVGYSWQGH
ncbi:hypothetical protein EGW08_019058 [Elysia chlorotica]|uniref:Uncharacterized protein n=1 Tax=Elysia chlorotica TaxID=188477 RepID=A0A3S1B0J8_ELYCH|nr:hypothetical protein EGW08_019058 [Elysia chlorotica]